MVGNVGTPKDVVGVNIWLDSFNGVDNNEPIPWTVRRNLTWNTWHAVTLVVDQATDRYVSLEVDGRVQDLSAYRLPRSKTDTNVWERGQLMEFIRAEIVPNVSEAGASEDDVYWDNVNIVVERPRGGKSQ